MSDRPKIAAVTAESLTDEQILQFGRGARDGTMHDAIVRELCVRALGLRSPTDPAEWIGLARQRIAAAINARAKVGAR